MGRDINQVLNKILNVISNLDGFLTLGVLTQMDKEHIIALESEEENVDFLGFKRYNEGLREALNREYSIALVFRSSIFPMPHKPPVKLMYKGLVVGEMLYDNVRPGYKGRFIEVFKGFVIYPDLMPKEYSEKMHVKLVYLKRFPEFVVGLNDIIDDPVFGDPSPKVHDFLLKKFKISSIFDDIATGILGFNIKNP